MRRLSQTQFASTPRQGAGRRTTLIGLWLFVGILMLIGLGGPDVSRTQEARVLETAREMLGSGLNGWIIPHINGRIRLEKPPLCYWLAAASFKIFGVNEAAGRAPFALLGWLTIALTYRIAARLFGAFAGLLSAAALAGCYIFARHARLAETDGPATLFITAAIWWSWLACDQAEGRPRLLLLHGAAAALALAFMSKQGTIAYPILFILAKTFAPRFVFWVETRLLPRTAAAGQRSFPRAPPPIRWQNLTAWFSSGSIVTFVIIGVPWWCFAGYSIGWSVFWHELRNVTEGKDHSAWFFQYLPMLAQALAPWIGMTVVAVIAAVGRWRQDEEERGLLNWSAAILLPLCVIGNKQFHYLLPLAVPLMILTGWGAAQALKDLWPQRLESAFRAVLILTIVALIAAAIAVPLAAKHAHDRPGLIDLITAGAVGLVALWALVVFIKQPPAAVLVLLLVTPVVLLPLLATWAPTLAPRDHRTLGLELRRRFGDGPYCFYGVNESLPLSFALRAAIPQVTTETGLRDMLAREPRLVVIAETKNRLEPPPLPAGLDMVAEEPRDDQIVRVYTRAAR